MTQLHHGHCEGVAQSNTSEYFSIASHREYSIYADVLKALKLLSLSALLNQPRSLRPLTMDGWNDSHTPFKYV